MVYSPKKYRETEGTKVRRLGFALDEATLKQVAFNHGITQSFESMTQAQKSQLRYVTMIEQAKNIGVTGDMSRTIDTAANGVRILEARIQQFARAVGNMLMPALSAILPYLTAFIQVVTEGANALAEMFGFELPKINLDGITNGYDDITAATEDATAATEKFKGSLAGVDQLNIIGSKNTTSGTDANQYDLNIDLPEYDFLNGVESKTKQIAENMKQWFMDALPWIEAVGAAIAGFTISQGLINGIKALGTLKTAMSGLSSKIAPVSIALAAGAASGTLLYNSIKKLSKGEGGLPELIGGLTVAGGAIAAFAALGNPIGVVVTALLAVSGAILGCSSAAKELSQEAYNSIVYTDHGTSIQTIADSYSDWTASITTTDDKIQQNQDTISGLKDTIDEQLTTLSNLTSSFEAAGKMSEEMAKKISEACSSISTSISDTLTTELNNMILGVGNSWETVSEKAGMAKEEIINTLYAMKNNGDLALTELSKTMSENAAILATSEKGSIEWENAYQGYYDAYYKMDEIGRAAIGQNDDAAKLKNQLSSLTDSQIALMDADTALSALNQISESYKTATDKMLQTKITAETNADSWAATLNAAGVEVDYSVIDALKSGYKTEYESRIGELNSQTEAVVKAIQDRIDELNGNATTEALSNSLSEVYAAANGSSYNQWLKIGQEFNYGVAYWRGLFGGTDALSVMTEDFEKDSGISALREKTDEILAEINATAISSGTALGENIVQGQINGIESKTSELNESIKSASESAIGTAEDTMEIGSPSKVFYEIGGYMMEGWKNGISDNVNSVLAVIDMAAVEMVARVAKIKKDLEQNNLGDISISGESGFFPQVTLPSTTGTDPGFASRNISDMISENHYGSSEDKEITVNLQNYTVVEMDGESVGEAMANKQIRQVMVTNGR